MPLGAPLPSDAESVAARAAVAVADIEAAQRWAREMDRRLFRMLFLDWDARVARYRASSRVLTPAEAKGTLRLAISRGELRARAVSEKLIGRRISLADWHTEMGRVVKSSQLNAVSAARGGWAQMGPADYARASNAIRKQNRYLDRRAAAIASGEQPLDGTLTRRAAMYPRAALATYENDRRAMLNERCDEERRVATASESCSGCLTAAAAGWQKTGLLPAIGSAECLSACLCHFEFRNTTTGETFL